MPRSLLFLLVFLLSATHPVQKIPDSPRAANIRARIWPRLQRDLKAAGLRDDQPVFIRIFKKPGILELWVRSGNRYKLFREYLVCTYSGGLGTKKRSGDGKSPEGYYTIQPKQLNPVSNYHLAINIGYPNPLERQRGYTGDEVMIHGDCKSIGCYAMTDPMIEEIYTMAYEAFLHGQKTIQVDIFPFRLTNKNLDAYSEWPDYHFWEQLKPGYDIFEKTHVPPVVEVAKGNYSFK
ncbi:MAG TPA: murein L,D-transpeptidase family protein [Mucilaginibacter sp.]|nr:murein L,D-transpeptidase family protein [Mucilaginibacter sp.]